VVGRVFADEETFSGKSATMNLLKKYNNTTEQQKKSDQQVVMS